MIELGTIVFEVEIETILLVVEIGTILFMVEIGTILYSLGVESVLLATEIGTILFKEEIETISFEIVTILNFVELAAFFFALQVEFVVQVSGWLNLVKVLESRIPAHLGLIIFPVDTVFSLLNDFV